MKLKVPLKYPNETAIIVGTGPSLNPTQVNKIRWAKMSGRTRIITVNNSYQLFNFIDVHVACNHNWWEHYLKNDRKLVVCTADKWTRLEEHETRIKRTEPAEFAVHYNINCIQSIIHPGLSRDPSIVHFNHGSGPMAMNLATLYGFKKIILVGHDMKFAKDYDGRKKVVGSTPRHWFGEYPKEMQHWPSVRIGLSKPGNIDGLIEQYETFVDDLNEMSIDVVNCTPDSELKCFRTSTLEKEL